MRKTLRSFFNIVISAVIAAVPLAVFTFAPQIAHAGTNQCSWTSGGGNTLWSNASNWSCSVGTVPTTGYDLIFPRSGYTAGQTLSNDLSATNTYGGIWLTVASGTCNPVGGDLNFSGNDLRLGAAGFTIIDDIGCLGTLAVSSNVILTTNTVFDLNSHPSIPGDQMSLSIGNLALGTNNLTIDANSGANMGSVSLGVLSGSGSITSSGDLTLSGNSSSYSGNIVETNGLLSVYSANSLGNNTGSTTVGSLASVNLAGGCGSSIASTNENFIFSGAASSYGGGSKLNANPGCGGGPGTDVSYSGFFQNWTLNLTGNITVTSSFTVEVQRNITLSGTINGAGQTITLLYDSTPGASFAGGTLLLNGSSNNTSTPNGTYRNPVHANTLSDALPATSIDVGSLSTVSITGTRGQVIVHDGGVLKGTGTIGDLSVYNGAIIAPGMSPGTLNSGNVTYDNTTTHQEELGGTGAGNFDQLNVTGTVNLGSATLATSLYGGYVPVLNDSFVIINNDGSDAITGTFAGLAQNAEFTLAGGYKFRISYTGGTGNDVTLTSTYVPGPPGTGLGSLTSSVYLPVAAILTGAGIMLIARKKHAVKAFARR